MYTVLYIKQITNKDLLYSTRNYTQYFVITYKFIRVICVYICVCVCVCVCVYTYIGKENACNAGDQGWISGLGRPLREGNGNSLQYSCLENPMDRGAQWATVLGVTKNQTWLSGYHFHSSLYSYMYIYTHTYTHTRNWITLLYTWN